MTYDQNNFLARFYVYLLLLNFILRIDVTQKERFDVLSTISIACLTIITVVVLGRILLNYRYGE
jgi:hypothetical protein